MDFLQYPLHSQVCIWEKEEHSVHVKENKLVATKREANKQQTLTYREHTDGYQREVSRRMSEVDDRDQGGHLW